MHNYKPSSMQWHHNDFFYKIKGGEDVQGPYTHAKFHRSHSAYSRKKSPKFVFFLYILPKSDFFLKLRAKEGIPGPYPQAKFYRCHS